MNNFFNRTTTKDFLQVCACLLMGAIFQSAYGQTDSDDDTLLLILPAIIAATKEPSPPPPPPIPVPGPAQNIPPTDQCAFTINGPTLSANRTLVNTPSRCDYFIQRPGNPTNSQVLQIDGATLTIRPGVVVRLARGLRIRVLQGGAIRAIGNQNNRIRFESAGTARGASDGIFFGSGSLSSRLEFVDFVNLGTDSPLSNTADAIIDGSKSAAGVSVKHVSFNRSGNHAADFTDLNITGFEKNGFYNNNGYPMEIGADQLHKLDKPSRYQLASQPNALPRISVHGVFEPANSQQTWKNLSVPYRVFVSIEIEDGGHITIEPGTRFAMDEGAGIDINPGGSLRAVGTASNPIRFFGLQQTPGFWDNIRFTLNASDARNRLENVVVSHGGGNSIFEGAINLQRNSSAVVTSSAIRNSASSGVCIDPGALVNATQIRTQNSFSGNADGNVIVSNDC